MARKPLSFGDVVEARQAESRESERAARTLREHRERTEAILKAHPEIGVLQREAGLVYYVNFPEYREAADPADLVEEG